MRFCFQKNKTSENKNAAAFFVFSDVIQLKKKHSGGSAARPRAVLQRMGTMLQRRLQSKTGKHIWAWHRLGEHITVLLRNVWGKCNHKYRKARRGNTCVPDIVSVNWSRYRFLEKSKPAKLEQISVRIRAKTLRNAFHAN